VQSTIACTYHNQIERAARGECQFCSLANRLCVVPVISGPSGNEIFCFASSHADQELNHRHIANILRIKFDSTTKSQRGRAVSGWTLSQGKGNGHSGETTYVANVAGKAGSGSGNLSGRQAPRQGEHFDLCGTGQAENVAAFVDRAPGCEDIVDQKHPLVSKLGAIGKDKGFFQVTSSLYAAEVRLGNGGSMAEEQVGPDPVPPLREAGCGDNQGLVESPVSQAGDMQGHRQDAIRLGELLHKP